MRLLLQCSSCLSRDNLLAPLNTRPDYSISLFIISFLSCRSLCKTPFTRFALPMGARTYPCTDLLYLYFLDHLIFPFSPSPVSITVIRPEAGAGAVTHNNGNLPADLLS